jgi:beta-lactamase regulating signal transducer with metallopeptidase domain
MTHLGITLATAAVQVTLAAVPAVVLVAWAGRRSPRAAAAFAAVALALALALTATCFAPRPAWWAWPGQAERHQPHASSGDTPLGAHAHGTRDQPGWPFPVARWAELLSPGVEPGPGPNRWTGWAVWAGVCLTGAAVGCVRMLIGLRAVVSCRRRSRPVDDASLRRLADELRAALGCRRRVEVRTSPAVGTAATVGWLRPTVLLADGWPAWSVEERRAVLAHELAHVCRGDYVAALLACGCGALHFYHPLVRWLAGRLRLDQELAADALAAPVAGGRATYLAALARMALRQERFFAAGVARPFVSDRNSLLRRVSMLRVMDDGRPLSRAAGWGLVGLLLAAAVGASAVRGTAQPPAGETASPAAAADLPPLDLSCVPASADGVVVVRPAALFGRPELKSVAETWSRLLKADMGLDPDFGVALDDIELAVGPFEMRVLTEEERKRNPNGERHSVVMGLTMIRLTPGHDWRAKLKALPGKAGVTEVKPGVFEVRAATFGPLPMTMTVQDPRTLVLTLPLGPQDTRPGVNGVRWGAAGQAVERAGLAVLIDNRKGRWTDALTHVSGMAPAVKALGRPTHLAFGLNWGEVVGVTAAADFADEPTNEDVTRGAETLRGLVEDALKLQVPTEPTPRLIHGLEIELVRSAQVRRRGHLVTVEARAAMRWVDLLRAIPVVENKP